MKILVTNDDGINALSIMKLVESISKLGEIIVVAPDRERSATGHAITLHQPLRVEKVNRFSNGIEAWSINGTPSDCVKIALESIMAEEPGLILSGFNNGANLGTDVIYSGTVSAAIEGAIHGIPSFAFSIAGQKGDINYEGAVSYTCKIINRVLKKKVPNNMILNINLPSTDANSIKGIKITELGIRKYTNQYIQRQDPMGKNYYWLSGKLIEIENTEESDVMAVENNYISITPLQYDLTNFLLLDEMKKWSFR